MFFDEQLVVVKAVPFVPEAVAAKSVHGVNNLDKVLEKFGGDILVSWPFLGQLQCHGKH